MRGLCGLLAIAMALSPLPVLAQEPEELAKVEALYDEGLALYDTADYDGAIAKWTQAYSMVGDSPQSADIKATLLYNLASAHEAAFDIDADITHLTKARVLLERFDQNIEELYEGEAIASERERVQQKIAGIDAKLAEARGDEVEPDDEPEPDPEPDDESVPPPDPSSDATPKRPGRPLVIAGSVLVGLGLGGVGAGIAGTILSQNANTFDEEALDVTQASLDLRHEQINYGQQMNVLSYVGFVAGGVLVVTGATLLGLSARKRAARSTALVPVLNRGHAGLMIQGSF
jgi:tetratricopeptide (TPR) repeat protein